MPADPMAFQAGCVEAFVALWSARGFSPVTVENDIGFHRCLEVRKAAEIRALFEVRLICPVDEFNASRHFADDSPAMLPPLTPERVAGFFEFLKARIATARKYVIDDLDHARSRVHLGKRPTSMPLDPTT